MKTYVLTTAIIFGLIVFLHIWRAIEEGPHTAANPLYILLTLIAAGLSIWGFVLARRPIR
jgi:tetrahydromethanopterin S-methyltransferase subunit E